MMTGLGETFGSARRHSIIPLTWGARGLGIFRTMAGLVSVDGVLRSHEMQCVWRSSTLYMAQD
jgi:hypothetical protein